MTEQDFLLFFSNIVGVNPKSVNMDEEFRYMDEWNSMAGLAFLTEIREKFGKTINISEFKESETISDLYNLFKKK